MVACGRAAISVGQPNAPSSASRDVRLIPVSDDAYPFARMTCSQCAQTIAAGVLDCPVSDARFDYTEIGSPWASTFANPDFRKQVDAPPYVCYGSNRAYTVSADERNLMQHVQRSDNTAAIGDEDKWHRERAQFGCCRLRNTRVATPWVSTSPDQMPPAKVTLSLEDWILYCVGSFRGGASAEAGEVTLAQRARQLHLSGLSGDRCTGVQD